MPHPGEDMILGCEQLRPSILSTSLNLLLLLAIIPSHLPQIYKIASHRSLHGISPYFFSWHFSFSTFFLCFMLGYSGGFKTAAHPVTCIEMGLIGGFDAMGVLMPLLQVGLQWVCALILLVLSYTYDRFTPTHSELTSETLQWCPKFLNPVLYVFEHYPTRIASHLWQILVLTLAILIAKGVNPPHGKDVTPVIQLLIYALSVSLVVFLTAPVAWIVQMLYAWDEGQHEGLGMLSLWGLGFEMIVTSCLAASFSVRSAEEFGTGGWWVLGLPYMLVLLGQAWVMGVAGQGEWERRQKMGDESGQAGDLEEGTLVDDEENEETPLL